jgi:hypothetical protein
VLHGVIGLARSASSRSFQAGTRDRLTSCSRTLTRADLLSRQARFSQLVDRPIYPREAAGSSLGEVPSNVRRSSVRVTWRSRSICPNSALTVGGCAATDAGAVEAARPSLASQPLFLRAACSRRQWLLGATAGAATTSTASKGQREHRRGREHPPHRPPTTESLQSTQRTLQWVWIDVLPAQIPARLDRDAKPCSVPAGAARSPSR